MMFDNFTLEHAIIGIVIFVILIVFKIYKEIRIKKRSQNIDQKYNNTIITNQKQNIYPDDKIPDEAFIHTKLYKKYSKGWFSILGEIKTDKNKIWVGEYTHPYYYPTKVLMPFYHSFTIVSIYNKNKISEKFFNSLLYKHKYCGIHKNKVKTYNECMSNYVFIWFDDILDYKTFNKLILLLMQCNFQLISQETEI